MPLRAYPRGSFVLSMTLNQGQSVLVMGARWKLAAGSWQNHHSMCKPKPKPKHTSRSIAGSSLASRAPGPCPWRLQTGDSRLQAPYLGAVEIFINTATDRRPRPTLGLNKVKQTSTRKGEKPRQRIQVGKFSSLECSGEIVSYFRL